jgi:large subunit ribosomal protein L15
MPVLQPTRHPSHNKEPKRKGRGIGSGNGRTGGRGDKGQKTKRGIHPRFEGGRAPEIRHMPKYAGFKHHSKPIYFPINLGQFNEIDADTVIDLVFLAENGLLPKKLRGLKVKLLGDGEFTKKLIFKLHAYSHAAKARVEEFGGACEVIS